MLQSDPKIIENVLLSCCLISAIQFHVS